VLMADLKQCEFFLLRYVPDAVKDEFVNVGVVMVEAGTNGSGFADARFTHDWRRVQCLDPQADVEWLQALERDIRGQLGQAQDRAALVSKLEDSLSNGIQLSQAKGILAEDPAREMNSLVALYLESAAAPSVKRELVGRQRILAHMREEFDRAGVLPLLTQRFAVAPYTKDGDPLKFDFGYTVGSEIKFLHAVALGAGVDQAVILAARFPEIAEVLLKKTRAEASLTAVVDELDSRREEVGFALAMMQEKGMHLAAMGEMGKIAEEVRLELGA
jgi:hypothetical protein